MKFFEDVLSEVTGGVKSSDAEIALYQKELEANLVYTRKSHNIMAIGILKLGLSVIALALLGSSIIVGACAVHKYCVKKIANAQSSSQADLPDTIDAPPPPPYTISTHPPPLYPYVCPPSDVGQT